MLSAFLPAPLPSCCLLLWRRAWVQIVGEEATRGMSIACIGSTSARAAEKLGLQAIKYAEEPGVDTWAAVVQECLQERQLLPAA